MHQGITLLLINLSNNTGYNGTLQNDLNVNIDRKEAATDGGTAHSPMASSERSRGWEASGHARAQRGTSCTI
jgi:hypothetical protein